MRLSAVLAVVAAALAAYILLVDHRRPSTEDRATAKTRLLPGFEPAALERIAWTRPGEAPYAIERRRDRQDPAWWLSPGDKPADDRAVEDLVAALAFAESDRTANIDDKAAGLTPPTVVLRLRTDALTAQIDFGRLDASGQGAYARTAAGGPIRVIAAHLRELVDRPADALRDRRLLTFAPGTVTAMVWRDERGAMGGLDEREGRWKNERGEWVREERVDALLRTLSQARATAFTTPPPPASTVSLSIRSGVDKVVLSPAGAGAAAADVIVRDAGGGDRDALRMSAGFFAEIEAQLRTVALKDDRLLASPPESVSQIELRAGDRRLVLKREGRGWAFGAPEVPYRPDAEVIERWLAELHRLSVPVTPPDDRRSLRYLSVAGRYQEHQELRAGAAYDLLDPSPLRFRERRVLSFARFDVRRLRRQTGADHEDAVELATPDGESWRVVHGSGGDPDIANLNRVVATLDDLRASAFRTRAVQGVPTVSWEVDVQAPGDEAPARHTLAIHAAPGAECTGHLDDDAAELELSPDSCANLRLSVVRAGSP